MNQCIGTAGIPWGDEEKTQWLAQQTIQRSYQEEVLSQLADLPEGLERVQYGALSYDAKRYPLFLIKNKRWDDKKPCVLITGGVHGYETSGVHGALRFIHTKAQDYPQFNLLIAPCVSPWGYETINRWNPYTVDPNRSFFDKPLAEESGMLMAAVHQQSATWLAHVDLHETTDTDNTVFRPALEARDAVKQSQWDIPDGFYLVGNSEHACEDFYTAIIDGVSAVTHIAEPDSAGQLIGELMVQPGVIHYPAKDLGLCKAMTPAKYTATTEVYPDSPRVDDENCTQAQVEAVVAALDYLSRITVSS